MDKKDLDEMYKFMAKAYQGNWQYRFGDTPFMSRSISEGKRESILAHQWALMEFWFQLRRLCKELNSAVDPLKIYEMILNHDLGETVIGDISLTRQLAGEGKDKHIDEHQQIKGLTEKLDTSTSRDILNLFDEYEQKSEEVNSLEVLVARFIDYLEGHHFALVFGQDLVQNSELIETIVKSRWVIFTQKLIDELKNKGFNQAAEEVRVVAEHHIGDIKNAGIKLEFEGFK